MYIEYIYIYIYTYKLYKYKIALIDGMVVNLVNIILKVRLG